MLKYNKDELKQSLTIDQVMDLVAEVGGEPRLQGDHFIARTICHNPAGSGSHKLYYYDNTKLFKCFTACDDTFDIFQLIMKVKHFNLHSAIVYVAKYFNYTTFQEDFDTDEQLEDWKVFAAYEKRKENLPQEQIVELQIFDSKILDHLPSPRIPEWEAEGISREVMQHRGIAFDPVNEGIVIPHYDQNNNLIGIRERTLIKEEEQYRKYSPARLDNRLYNHPISFNLYNLNNSKHNIKKIKKAIVFESEKATLQYASYFGEENDISVAVCGSSLIKHQMSLLLDLKVEEVIIAFDKQFKELNDDEHLRWCKKLKDIHKRYSSLVQISFIFDLNNLLGYKMAPTDKGPETFMKLFKERIYL